MGPIARLSVARSALVAVGAAAVLAACASGQGPGPKAADALAAADVPATITVTSPAFGNGAPLPTRFTCDGTNISPSLRWQNLPPATAELAIVADDPDASGGTHVHWIVVAIPPNATGAAEDAIPEAAKLTEQSENRARWQGPCPPKGGDPHTYRFTVYALGKTTGFSSSTKMVKALDGIRANAVAKGEIRATFQR